MGKDLLKGVAAIARALGVDPPTVRGWIKTDPAFPAYTEGEPGPGRPWLAHRADLEAWHTGHRARRLEARRRHPDLARYKGR